MKDFADIPSLMADIGAQAKAAAVQLANANAERKHAALISAAEHLWRNRADIISANELDMDYGRDKGLSAAMLDRLRLDEDRIQSMVDGLRAVAERTCWVGGYPRGRYVYKVIGGLHFLAIDQDVALNQGGITE